VRTFRGSRIAFIFAFNLAEARVTTKGRYLRWKGPDGLWSRPNPIDAVERRPEPKRAYITLRADEVPLLLAAVPDGWRPVFAAAVYTGLRKGELSGLRKIDVDLDHRTITVRRSHGRETTKGGHADEKTKTSIYGHLVVEDLRDAINLLPPSPFAASLLQDPGSTPSGVQSSTAGAEEIQGPGLERETGIEPATLSLGS